MRRTTRRIAAVGVALTVGLLGPTACSNGTEVEPTTEEPGFSEELPDADNADEQSEVDDEQDDDDS